MDATQRQQIIGAPEVVDADMYEEEPVALDDDYEGGDQIGIDDGSTQLGSDDEDME